MLKWKVAIMLVAGALATAGLKGLTAERVNADVSPVALTSEVDDAARRDDLADDLIAVADGDDGTGGGANTGDGDWTGGDDGTSGGANTGDGDWTGGDDGTGGGANTGDGDWTGGGANTHSAGSAASFTGGFDSFSGGHSG